MILMKEMFKMPRLNRIYVQCKTMETSHVKKHNAVFFMIKCVAIVKEE